MEFVLPEGNTPHFGTLADIVMLAIPSGEERTNTALSSTPRDLGRDGRRQAISIWAPRFTTSRGGSAPSAIRSRSVTPSCATETQRLEQGVDLSNSFGCLSVTFALRSAVGAGQEAS